MIRTIILIATALVMVAVMVLTWGSIGSAVMGFCLVMMGASLLYQKALLKQDEMDIDWEG